MLPQPKILDELDPVIDSLIDAFSHWHVECRALAATRDALLPSLTSGELRVKDAE